MGQLPNPAIPRSMEMDQTAHQRHNDHDAFRRPGGSASQFARLLCCQWLRDVDVQTHDIDNAILQESLRIKNLLGVEGDRYGAGVGENDILIIATASLRGKELVTDEAWQPNLPLDRLKYKIPAVCSLPAIRVSWINFLDFIKRSEAVFR